MSRSILLVIACMTLNRELNIAESSLWHLAGSQLPANRKLHVGSHSSTVVASTQLVKYQYQYPSLKYKYQYSSLKEAYQYKYQYLKSISCYYLKLQTLKLKYQYKYPVLQPCILAVVANRQSTLSYAKHANSASKTWYQIYRSW